MRRSFHRCFAGLGIGVMLGALVAVTMTASMAVAGPPPAAAAMDHMPCHEPAKPPCPDCPEKGCPDLGSCLIKCFQTLSQPASEAALSGGVARAAVLPGLSRVASGSPIAPPLRPPIV